VSNTSCAQDSTLFELERQAGSFSVVDVEGEERALSGSRQLLQLSSLGLERSLSKEEVVKMLLSASASGRVGCLEGACPDAYSRASRDVEGAVVVATAVRGQGIAGDARRAAAVLEEIQQRTPSWRVVLTSAARVGAAMELKPVLNAMHEMARELQGTNGTNNGTTITMSSDVLLMLGFAISMFFALGTVVACVTAIQTPSRFSTEPLPSGKNY
jgi:hypothetical protein